MSRHLPIASRAVAAGLLAIAVSTGGVSGVSAATPTVWDSAGASISIPHNTVDSVDFGVRADDGASDAAAINAAIQAVADEGGGVVTLPSGTLKVDSRIRLLSNVVLRGVGDSTKLELSVGNKSAIYLGGQAKSNGWQQLESDVSAGSSKLPGVALTGMIEIDQTNTDEITTQSKWDASWGKRSEGEMAVVGADGSLELPLVSSYTTSRSARYRAVTPIENAGLENFAVTRVDNGNGHTIQIRYGLNVWVKGITSTDTGRIHLAVRQTSACSIVDNTFEGTLRNGDGGEGYGVSFGRHTTGCHVTGNELSGLRHAIIIQLGASGNVFESNTARGSAGYADQRPKADISLHGHWPQHNLFRNNIVDRIEIGDWWGPAGPENTFIDNCVLDHLYILDHSNDQVFSGNYFGEIVEDDSITRSSFTDTLDSLPTRCGNEAEAAN